MNNPFENQTEVQNEVRELSACAREFQTAAGGAVADGVAGWLAGQYLTVGREELAGAHGARRLEILRAFVRDWSFLRHGDHRVSRMQLEREKLELRRTCTDEAKEKEFRRWMERPDIREEFPKPRGGITPETMKMIEEAAQLL